LHTRHLCLTLLAALLAGCGGGGGGPTNQLYQAVPGRYWEYSFAGTVTLPDGSVETAKNTSTLKMEVRKETSRDLNNTSVRILDRTYSIERPDGRKVTATQRLYFTQTAEGIFLHGINFTMGETVDPARDVFVPGTADPPFRFLYLPNPVPAPYTHREPSPLGTAGAYEVTVGAAQGETEVPAGRFITRPLTLLRERFVKIADAGDFVITNGRIAPDTGMVTGTLFAKLTDNTELEGTLRLVRNEIR